MGLQNPRAGIDSEGVVWVNDRFTDRVIGFDRRKCAVLSGPTATGSHCPEGWTVHRKADQTFRGSDLNADLNYLITVDTYGTAGLGTDIPAMRTGGSTTRTPAGRAGVSGHPT